MATKCKFWDVHVEGYKSRGYSVVVAAKDAEEAKGIAIEKGLIEEGDYDDIDYAWQITRAEFIEMGGDIKSKCR